MDSPLIANMQFYNPAFKSVDTEAKFMKLLQKVVDSGKAPPKLLPLWEDFFNSYNSAIIGSTQVGANEKLVAQVQSSICDVVLNQFVDPYTFPSFHKRLLEPYDYYAFGQRYVGSLTDFDNSILGHPERWAQMNAWLEAGDNVILLANHQTEADPGVFAHMLEASFPNMATDVGSPARLSVFVATASRTLRASGGAPRLLSRISFGLRACTLSGFSKLRFCSPSANRASGGVLIGVRSVYVAGDRVVTDALCKPFSMGRNLFCVHSKKHMDYAPELKGEEVSVAREVGPSLSQDPELKAAKMDTNRKTLVAMSRRLNEGGALLWIAPSGGRDRPKADGKWSPDPFDPSAVDLMRSLGSRAKKPTHIVPMAMFSHPMMPPPPAVGAEGYQ
ncbi:hypothetical protein FOA52_006263 [Chlamydomonas sp. UWO 241]|nr:hypothetical protein FOA52_006263 [Chlamydomonas sp. UWO 241]